MLATQVSRADTKSFVGNGECAVLANFPLSIRIKGFEEPTNVRALTWPERWEAGRHRQSAASKGLFDDTNIVAVVASPRGPVEVTGHQVHLLAEHHCTNREGQLLIEATFLGVNVSDVRRHGCGCFLAAGRLSTKRGT